MQSHSCQRWILGNSANPNSIDLAARPRVELSSRAINVGPSNFKKIHKRESANDSPPKSSKLIKKNTEGEKEEEKVSQVTLNDAPQLIKDKSASIIMRGNAAEVSETLQSFLESVIDPPFLPSVKEVLSKEGIIEGKMWKNTLRALAKETELWWSLPLRRGWLAVIKDAILTAEEKNLAFGAATVPAIQNGKPIQNVSRIII